MKYPAGIYLQYIIFALLFTASSFFISSTALDYACAYFTEDSALTAADSAPPLLVIDPGHGGEDGGASSGDVLEKNLNLMISENLCDLCAVFGYDVLMTRTEDKLLYDLYDDLTDYTGKKKTYDLRNRLRAAEESHAALMLSIHMNKFTSAQYKGLQVYYSPNHEGSQTAASMIQSYARTYLMPDNNREIKKGTDAIYILNRIRMPAVLVECGFLSNTEELTCLTSAGYRKKLAAAVFAAAAEYLASEG